MNILFKQIEYEISELGNDFIFENILIEPHIIYEQQQFKIIQKDNKKIIYKYISHNRVGDVRIIVKVIDDKVILQIYEHYSAYFLHVYLLTIGIIAYVYGFLSSSYILFSLILIFLYFVWIMVDTFHDVIKIVKSIVEQKYLKNSECNGLRT